jgi:hypothetical protein
MIVEGSTYDFFPSLRLSPAGHATHHRCNVFALRANYRGSSRRRMRMQKTRTPLHRSTNRRILSLLWKRKSNGFLSSFISSHRLSHSYPPPAATSILLLSPPPFIAVADPRSHMWRDPGGKGGPQIRWLRLAAAKEATPTNEIAQV